MMNIANLSARNVGCAAARGAIHNGSWERGNRFTTTGFYCYVLQQFVAPTKPPEVTGQTIRCVSGARAFRFSWAT